ncbi:Auxin Efflux Carrier family protein [Trichomonas vaginalis G3]|uniref:Auxin Efflux Carrier family protein n=1 Tax=Trichomonas vaginalis (strain ATCC PRA-98 / G3) TaxID=412133 RepID=A2EX19_TRIV3|nr:intracellular auxin transport [Trichomonas vaginalis G3]EAY02796.1 Auxin Efflux Carrier family protein [Trichomonas vaginalis G3]KAI5537563.1 intracellular auxin transport [Trichomonas vaginalis G3]|eukprot:XP_001315019.1 Auxin Efflux Carrier family protein [Trichomonas vaginalis G3]
MTNYVNVIQVGVSMLLIIAVGFILAKLKIVTLKDSGSLNGVVFFIGFMPLIIRGIAPKKLKELDFQPFGIAALMSISTYISVAFMMVYPFKDRLQAYLSTVFPCAYINYIISGIPVFNALWPAKENVMVSMMMISNDLISSPIFLIMVGIYGVVASNRKRVENGLPPEKFSFAIIGKVLLGVIKSPILIGNVIGIIYSACNIQYPIFLDRLFQYAGDMVFALALVCVGVFLAQHSLISCGWLQFIFCIIVRCFIGPMFAGLWCKALGMSAHVARQCMIIGAQPTAVASYAITSGAHLGEGCASTMIFWTTVLCVPTLIVWFSILDGLKIYVE